MCSSSSASSFSSVNSFADISPSALLARTPPRSTTGAGQPGPDVHLGEEAIVGEEPREVDEGKDVEIKDEVVVKQTDYLEEKLPADVRIPVILGHVEAVWVTPAKWVEGIVEMVTQVEAKLQGMPIDVSSKPRRRPWFKS